MSDLPSSNPRPAGTAARAFFKALVRLLVILLLAVLVGALLYLAYVVVYHQAIELAHENDYRINLVETRQAAAQAQTNDQIAGFEERLTALEIEIKQTGEDLSQAQADQENLRTALDEQAANLQDLEELNRNMNRNLSALATQTDGQTRLLSGSQYSLLDLEKEITVLKVAGLLNRSRLYMLQSNYGLAAEQVELAREQLASLQPQATPTEKGVLAAWMGRLDSALSYLPDQPVFAGDDLEIVWQMVLQGLSAPLPSGSVNPTAWIDDQTAGFTPTPTLPITLTQTGTPERLRLTATPTP